MLTTELLITVYTNKCPYCKRIIEIDEKCCKECDIILHECDFIKDFLLNFYIQSILHIFFIEQFENRNQKTFSLRFYSRIFLAYSFEQYGDPKEFSQLIFNNSAIDLTELINDYPLLLCDKLEFLSPFQINILKVILTTITTLSPPLVTLQERLERKYSVNHVFCLFDSIPPYKDGSYRDFDKRLKNYKAKIAHNLHVMVCRGIFIRERLFTKAKYCNLFSFTPLGRHIATCLFMTLTKHSLE